METAHRSQTWGTIEAFTWRDWGKPQNSRCFGRYSNWISPEYKENYIMIAFFYILSYSLVANHATIRRYIVWATCSVVK
jgi:hypothetical protein